MKKTIHLISQSGVSNPLPSAIEQYDSIYELINSTSLDEIIVSSNFNFESNNTFIKTLNAHVKHNPLIIFSDKLSTAEISKLIRQGAYAVYSLADFKNLMDILENEKLEIEEFTNENHNNKFLKLISEHVDDIFFQFDVTVSQENISWQLNYVSPQLEKICGQTQESYLSNQKLWWQMLHPFDIDEFVKTTKEAIKNQQIKKREYRIKHKKTGKFTWVKDSITPVFNKEGKVTHLYGVAKNIQAEKEREHELKETKLFSENLIKTSPNILYLLDYESGIMLHGLERFANFLGFSENEIKQMPKGVYSLIHEDDNKAVEIQEHKISISKNDEVVPVEIRLQHKEGHFIWVTIYSKIFKRDNTGKPIQEIGSVVDISNVRETEELFQTIAMSSKAGIIIILNDKIKFANPATQDILGFNESDLVDHSFLKIIDSSKFEQARKAKHDLISGKAEKVRNEQLLVCKNGKKKLVEIVSTPITFQGQVGILSTFLDISVIKQAEQSFRYLFNNSQDLIYIQNEKGEFIDVNDAVLEKYGYPKEIFIGKTPAFLGYPEMNDLAKVQNLSKQAWEGETVSFNWWGMKKNGEKFPKEVILKPGYYFNQKVLVATARDITDRHIADEEKSNLIQQLLEQNRDLEQFTYIISHNLRSPIVAILGLTQLFNRANFNNEENELIELIEKSTKGLDNIICDLSKTLSVRNHQDEIKEDCNLAEVVERVKHTLADSIQKSKAQFHTNIDEKLVFKTIKGYLQNIIYNLLSNAIKYRNTNVSLNIYIDCFSNNGDIVIKVTDNGIGMKIDSENHKIFGLHERLHYHVEGKGIGLYLVKQQVDALGGSIEVQSEIGKGTTFSITIPLKRKETNLLN